MVDEAGEIYLCEICGNKVKVLEAGGGTLVCCGEDMVPVTEQTSGPSHRKVKAGHPAFLSSKEENVAYCKMILTVLASLLLFTTLTKQIPFFCDCISIGNSVVVEEIPCLEYTTSPMELYTNTL